MSSPFKGLLISLICYLSQQPPGAQTRHHGVTLKSLSSYYRGRHCVELTSSTSSQMQPLVQPVISHLGPYNTLRPNSSSNPSSLQTLLPSTAFPTEKSPLGLLLQTNKVLPEQTSILSSSNSLSSLSLPKHAVIFLVQLHAFAHVCFSVCMYICLWLLNSLLYSPCVCGVFPMHQALC